MTFGTGKPIRHFSKALRNTKKRRDIILDRTERNSVIEGLPKFDDGIRKSCEQKMDAIAM
ncbi:hypothetical protein KKF55_01570 [Patescibacteria group bacterium]|nr:hypothetical protein [Patescibacteria group bacterium]